VASGASPRLGKEELTGLGTVFLECMTSNAIMFLRMRRRRRLRCGLCCGVPGILIWILRLGKLGWFSFSGKRSKTDVFSPDQLILMDDPAFLPDQALPALDFDFANMELGGDSRRSSQSMLSIRGRSDSVASSHSAGINLPSSSTHFGNYQLPLLDDPFQASSGQKAFGGTGRSIFDDEGDLFQDDMTFEFDPDGMMRDIDVGEREARRAGSVFPRLGSDGAAARVRKEHEDAGQGLTVIDDGGDFDMFNYGDEQLPDAEAFPAMSGVPMMAGGLGGDDVPQPLIVSDDLVHSQISQQEPSFESAEAPLKRRKKRAPKIVASDPLTELRASDLLQWQREYPDMMLAAFLRRTDKKANAQAKKNAFVFVYGSGLNGVGDGVGSSKLPSPLEMFSGDALIAKITGQVPASMAKKAAKRKRKDSEESDEEQQETPKRARQDGVEREDEIGRGSFDDGMMMDDLQEPSMDVEKGRDASSALADYPSSALMPWNVSASARSLSIQRGASASLPGRLPSSIGRRITEASPLVGRGSNVPGELGQFSMGLDDDDGMVMYGRSDNDDTMDDDAVLRRAGSQGLAASESQFELFGPAAQVDTQTAGSSQWVREALDREGENFFEYVKNTIEERQGDELGGGDDDEGEEYVTFEELFPPTQNSKIVAAQAFYHVLTLATRGRVWVEQDLDERVLEPWGEIRIVVANGVRV
jgi:meiotic recombination protein REC8